MYPIRGGSGLWEVQRGIFEVLTGDTLLKQGTNGIFDGTVPPEEDVNFPYIIVGESSEIARDRLAVVGRQVSQLIHVHSNYQGAKESKVLANRIIQLLDRRPEAITSPSWFVTDIQLELTDVLVEPDEIRHVVIRFRINLQARPL